MLKAEGMCYYCGRRLPEPGHTHLTQCWIPSASYREPPKLRYVCGGCRHTHPLAKISQLVRASSGAVISAPPKVTHRQGHKQVKLF